MSGDSTYTIVVGVDGRPAGQAALRWAINEARARNGRVRVVHAWVNPYDWQMENTFPVDEEALRLEARKRLNDAVSGIDTNGVRLEPELWTGDPRRALIDAARDADLLVVGSCGLGRVREALLGSVSHFCTHRAGGTVVVVHE